MKVKLSFIEDEPSVKGTVDLLVFPDCIRYREVTKENAEEICEHIVSNTTASVAPSSYVTGTWVFVCCHQ
jgi:hypothetical protein